MPTRRGRAPRHRATVSRPGGPSAPRAPARCPAPTARPPTTTTTWSARASAARFEVEPITVTPALAQHLPELEFGDDVQGRGDVVRDQQLGVRRERPGQCQALQLPARQPGALVADQQPEPSLALSARREAARPRAGAASVVSTAGRARAVPPNRGHASRCAQPDVVSDGAGQHPRQLADVAHLVGAQELLRVVHGLAVPAQLPAVVHDPGERAQQRGLPGADGADDEHQLARGARSGRRHGPPACRPRAPRRSRPGRGGAAACGPRSAARAPCPAIMSTPGTGAE